MRTKLHLRQLRGLPRRTLNPHLGKIDLGLHNDGPGFFTFETYPAAFVNLVAHGFSDYKGQPDVRVRLLKNLLEQYSVDLRGAQAETPSVGMQSKRLAERLRRVLGGIDGMGSYSLASEPEFSLALNAQAATRLYPGI